MSTQESTQPKAGPKVFISYSHDSPEHSERVLALSERLRQDGIETRLDQYVQGTPAEGWPRWMLDQLEWADYVLVVATETYYRRFRGREVPGKGKGVDWEGASITQQIYDDRSRTTKFVAVFCGPADDQFIPEPVRGLTYYDVTKSAGYAALYDFLLGQAGIEPGPLGKLKTKPRKGGTPLTHATPSDPPPTLNPLRTLKPPVADFVERQELAELRKKVEASAGGGLIIAGVQGAGGVGKTEMARRLAAELKDRFPDAQFEIDLQGASQNPLTPQQVMEQVIRAFHPQTAQLPDKLDVLRPHYLQALDGKRAMLLLDNARDKAQVEPLVPPPSCAVLITSRRRFILPKMKQAELGKLAAADARKLALEIAGQRPYFIGKNVDDLVDACGHLALAIRVAATAIVEKTIFSVPEHVARLRANRLNELGPVTAAFKGSYELLDAERQRAWRLLGIFTADFDREAALAVVADPLLVARGDPPGPGDRSAEATVSPEASEAARETLQSLVNASLLEFSEKMRRFRLHDLARDFALDRLRASDSSSRGNKAQTSEPPSKRARKGQSLLTSSATEEVCARFRHAAHFTEIGELADVLYLAGKGKIMAGLALFDDERKHLEAAFTFLSSLTSPQSLTARSALRTPHSLFERACRQLIALAKATGYVGELRFSPRERLRWEEAQAAAARAVGDRGRESWAIQNMGRAHAALNDLPKAIRLYKQALRKSRGIGHRGLEGTALQSMGSAYNKRGDSRKAITLCEKALTIAREIGDRRAGAAALSNLGIGHLYLGNFQKAIELHEQHLTIAREIHDLRGEARSLANQAVALYQLGRRAESLKHGEDALKIFEEINDPDGAKLRALLAHWRGEAAASQRPKSRRGKSK